MKYHALLTLSFSLILPIAAASQGFPQGSARTEKVWPERRTAEQAVVPAFEAGMEGASSALEADFEPTPQTGCDPMTVTFIDRSTGNPTSWEWDVNSDGTIDGTTQQFTYTYTQPGNYKVTLTVRDGTGASATASKEPYVVKPAIVPDAGRDTTICSGAEIPIGFEPDPGSGDPIFTWEPDLYLSDPFSPNPVAFPEETITYVLTIQNVGGCVTRDTITITVNPLPPFPEILRSGNTLTASVDVPTYRWYRDGTLIPEATAKSYTPTANGSYSVEVENASGCSNISSPINFVLDPSSGVGSGLTALDVRISPNPFDEGTLLRYDLPKDAQVTVTIHDILGSTVATLADERQPAGSRSIRIDGVPLAPGIYVCRLTIGDETHTRTIVRIR